MRHPDAHKAFMLESLPCNPRPFLLELNARIEAYGTAYIQSDEAKGILWLLNTMAYGQLFIIDANDEYVRLRMALDPKPGDPGPWTDWKEKRRNSPESTSIQYVVYDEDHNCWMNIEDNEVFDEPDIRAQWRFPPKEK
jgi:hypothetical protein